MPKPAATPIVKAKPSRAKSDEGKRKAAVRTKYAETTTMAAAAMVSVDKPLTTQQRAFVKFWAEGDSIPNAMHRAGYNDQPSYGYRMAKMPNILALYNEEKRLYEEAAQMTRKKVMDMLLESYDMAKLMSEPASMVSAAREVGKMCGYYEPVKTQVNVTVNGQVSIDRMSRLSDDELLKIIEQGAMNDPQSALGHPDTPPQLQG